MNSLENKAINIAIKELGETLCKVDKLKHQINFMSEDKVDIKTMVERTSRQCDDIMDNSLHTINEWLHSLEANKTR